jgi:predicted transcriptional regulator
LLSSFGDHTFQVANGNVGLIKNRGEFREGVAAVDYGMTRPAVEHYIAGKHDFDGVLSTLVRHAQVRLNYRRQQKTRYYYSHPGDKEMVQFYQSIAHDLTVSSADGRKLGTIPIFVSAKMGLSPLPDTNYCLMGPFFEYSKV